VLRAMREAGRRRVAASRWPSPPVDSTRPRFDRHESRKGSELLQFAHFQNTIYHLNISFESDHRKDGMDLRP